MLKIDFIALVLRRGATLHPFMSSISPDVLARREDKDADYSKAPMNARRSGRFLDVRPHEG